MASRAIYARVLVMREPRSEALETRESLHSRARVADRAYRTTVVGKLESMTAGAGRVARFARKPDARRIVVSLVAHEAGQSRMIYVAVLESRIILVRLDDLRCLGLRREFSGNGARTCNFERIAE